MVPKIQRNSSRPTPRNILECLICLKIIPFDETKHVPQVAEILLNLFEILCKYMEWSPPPLRYQFNFNNDVFPFCKECKLTLVTLHRSDQLLADVQEQITRVISKLSGKILSQNDNKKSSEMRNTCIGSSSNDILSEEILRRNDEKITYYRNLVDRRYSASVHLTVDTQAFSVPPKTIAIKEPDDYEATEKWMAVEHEKVDFESLGIVETHDAETIKASLCSEETKANEGTEDAEKKLPDGNKASPKDVQTEDSDYEPSIASQQNESLDDSDNFAMIAKLSVDGVKVQDEFEARCGELYDRDRNVGNYKCLLDEKGGFELNSGRTSPIMTKARKAIEPSDSTDDMENADSSIEVNASDTKGIEKLVKNEHVFSDGDQYLDTIKTSNERLQAKEDVSPVWPGSSTLESEERTKTVISDDAPIHSYLHPSNQETIEGDRSTQVGTSENVADEIQIRVESNIFRRPEFKNRIQKVGPSEYLLDDKISFEFVNNKWRCISCELECAEKDWLRRHFDRCPGNPPTDSVETLRFEQWIYDKLRSGKFQCRHCKKDSSSNDDAIVHLKRFHKGKGRRKKADWVELERNKFLCNKYPFKFTNKEYKCGSCSAAFTKKWEILGHIRSKHIRETGGKRMSIKSTIPDKFTVNDKFLFEKVNDEYRCCECIYSPPALRSMRDHMRERHINFGKFSCEICEKKFATKDTLTFHNKSHIEGRTSVCEICGKSYKSEHGLKLHKGQAHVDSSEKKFSCKICDKSFRIQAGLNHHSKIHERAICDVCGKHIGLTSLKEHLASHNKVKNYECKKCGKKYQRSASLYVHMKNHDGVKPYSCDICGMKFTQHYSVIRHKNIAHNPNKPTKRYGKSRKRKRVEILSEEEETDEGKTEQGKLVEEEDDSSEASSEEEEA